MWGDEVDGPEGQGPSQTFLPLANPAPQAPSMANDCDRPSPQLDVEDVISQDADFCFLSPFLLLFLGDCFLWLLQEVDFSSPQHVPCAGGRREDRAWIWCLQRESVFAPCKYYAKCPPRLSHNISSIALAPFVLFILAPAEALSVFPGEGEFHGALLRVWANCHCGSHTQSRAEITWTPSTSYVGGGEGLCGGGRSEQEKQVLRVHLEEKHDHRWSWSLEGPVHLGGLSVSTSQEWG